MVKRPLYYFLNVSNFFNYLTAILTLANIQLSAVYRKTEIIEEIHKCGIGYGVNIVTVISPYDYLIKTEPECFHVALGIKVEVPVITHNFTDIVEHFVDILGGLLQSTGVEKRSCLIYVRSCFGEHITERIGIVSCKEVEAVQAVIIKPFQYLTEYSTPAVDSTDKFICELLIVKEVAPELRYVPEYIIKADNAVCVLGDSSPYALVILSNNKYHVFSLLVDAIEQDFFIFAHITLLFYNVQDRIRYDNYTITTRKSQDNNVNIVIRYNKNEVINVIYANYNVILWI